jgi:hypothetical protein
VAACDSAGMITGHLQHTTDDALPYRIIVRRDGEIIRMEPAAGKVEGNRILAKLIRCEREYEKELRWYDVVELDA